MKRERRMNPKCLGRAIPDTSSARSADSTGLKMRRITRAVSIGRKAFDPCQRRPHLRISELAGIGQEATERFCQRAVVFNVRCGPNAESRFDFRRRCACRSIMIVAAAIALSIPRPETEFGTTAEIVILRADHRSLSMILAQPMMRRHSNEQGSG